MSRSIDLFIGWDGPVEALAEEIGSLTGLSMAPGALPGTWSMEEGDVRAELRAHPYGDDRDLLLRQFPFALSAWVGHDVRLADAPETNLLRVVSEALRRAGVTVLLVHDLQYRDPPDHDPGTMGAGPRPSALEGPGVGA